MQNVAKERKRPLKLSETDKKTNKQTNVDLDLRFPTKWETTSDLIFFTIKEVIFFARAVLFFPFDIIRYVPFQSVLIAP